MSVRSKLSEFAMLLTLVVADPDRSSLFPPSYAEIRAVPQGVV